MRTKSLDSESNTWSRSKSAPTTSSSLRSCASDNNALAYRAATLAVAMTLLQGAFVDQLAHERFLLAGVCQLRTNQLLRNADGQLRNF